MTRNERKALQIQRAANLKFESAIRGLFDAHRALNVALGEVKMLQLDDALRKGRMKSIKKEPSK